MKIENPWNGFAHPDHQSGELEPLVRTLRYALIDLQKFWVEVQSIPVFMNGLNACTLEEIEKIFQWVMNSPQWAEQIECPRLVPELAQPAGRKKVQDFARSLLWARAVLDELGTKVGAPLRSLNELDLLWKRVSEAQSIIERRAGGELKRGDLDARFAESARKWAEISDVLKFFARIAELTGAPLATQSHEGLKILRALDLVAQMPENVRSWRTAHILEPSQRIRLQAWRDRARPILELRKRLETFFNLDAPVSVDELTRLADALRADGLFSQFKAPYREALEKYRTLLQGGVALKVDSKNNGFQKAEKLKDWISLLEQSRAYSLQPEARQAFAPHFKGIDTDFTAALEANAWAKTLRDEFFTQDAQSPVNGVALAFDTAIIEFITGISEDRIAVAEGLLSSEEATRVASILSEDAFPVGSAFIQLEQERKRHCWDYRKLREITNDIALAPDVSMKEMKNVGERVEEAYFLIHRIESDDALRASLKDVYAGINTDLGLIEPCGAYVRAVKSAALPDGIEMSLLSTHGPQRLSDARSLVARCLLSVVTVREHYRKLEVATRDEVRSLVKGKDLESAPVIELMDRIQNALKNAQHLAQAIAGLRAGKASQFTGLKVDRETSNSSHSPCLIPVHHESGGD